MPSPAPPSPAPSPATGQLRRRWIVPARRNPHDAEILRLAVPAFGAAGWPLAPQIVHAFGGTPGVSAEAATYLRISLLGAPSMLVVLAAVTGVSLIVRTIALQAVLIVVTVVAARQGTAAIAAHQIAFRGWILLAYALDAIAIAGQAITGRYLGAGDVAGARAATNRMIGWGVVYGAVFGALLAAAIPLLPGVPSSPTRTTATAA